MSIIYGVIWAIIFGLLGSYFSNIGWEVLSFIAFAFAGMSIYTSIKIISGGRL